MRQSKAPTDKSHAESLDLQRKIANLRKFEHKVHITLIPAHRGGRETLSNRRHAV